MFIKYIVMISKILSKGFKIRDFVRRIYYNQNIPRHISNNYITLNNDDLELIKATLDANYSTLNDNGNDKNSVYTILDQRLEDHRKVIVPWLDSVRTLKNAKILEIGCGHGTSTLSLAEQGAKVTAIDVDETLLQAAKTRCEIYGLNVEFHKLNAIETSQFFTDGKFDFIIFWAVLEHMTLNERIKAMKDTFYMLPDGGLWCIIGTPNRLHFFDSHTSNLPFFNWLPDELAIKYSLKSTRHEYADSFQNYKGDPDEMLSFYRWGRGVSFHEIELAIKPLNELNIISTLDLFATQRGFILKLISKAYPTQPFEEFLRKQYPSINRCFFKPYLNLIIKK
jgi:2-polyprenyl-3-methyl-5-hydroxy-6-metoxy-1,4-benzoquinol methylase